MQDSIQRVRTVINGGTPDRAPIYELFRNDAVISHFAGETLTIENAEEVVYRAYEPALDATRPTVRRPGREETVTLEDGRQQRSFRWTTWTEEKHYPSGEAYAAAKRKQLDAFDPSWTPARQEAMDRAMGWIAEERRRLGEVFFFPSAPALGLTGTFKEVGLEQFCYYLADYPDVIDELFACQAVNAVTWVEHYPDEHGLEAVFVGDDIAFKTGPLLSPAWFDAHYRERFARVMAAYHARGIKVLFHSDGNLNALMDRLVEAGIDGLNPIEVLAGMDVADLHRRYPGLFMAGAIDVSQLLPFGSPREIKETVARTIDAAEGRIMVGSSTELNNEVPLENYFALRDAVLEHPC